VLQGAVLAGSQRLVDEQHRPAVVAVLPILEVEELIDPAATAFGSATTSAIVPTPPSPRRGWRVRSTRADLGRVGTGADICAGRRCRLGRHGGNRTRTHRVQVRTGVLGPGVASGQRRGGPRHYRDTGGYARQPDHDDGRHAARASVTITAIAPAKLAGRQSATVRDPQDAAIGPRTRRDAHGARNG
jgi:hypothetical protein